MKHNYQPKKAEEVFVVKVLCGKPVRGQENVKCVKCGCNIKFYVGGKPIVCGECRDK